MNSTRPHSQSGITLQFRGVTKTFYDRARSVEALQPFTTDVAAGEFVCLLGPSGCGKSTLLNIVAGLELPTAGQVLAGGKPITAPGSERALLFQEAALFPWLDVQANVEFGLRQQRRSAQERADMARSLLAMVHLTGFEHSAVHQLSGGMRQRVALARALAIDPAVILMDEPFGALDAITRDRMHAELEAIWSATGKTILFVTHNVREALALGDRILTFSPRPGRVVQEVRVTLPRPRSLESHALVDMAAQILSVMRTAEANAAALPA
ncbi:probable ATP-binding component of ABC transporters [Oscillochloris trichoides DG-6]|uniref:Probable ATP-binding component of ABC transporters n=1 Tax=Oscillochloris trichoides DG-6 TaxID=765420 RepID=E1IFP7_9CHLR|nr:ABC transporter ATP-binding protein [Oscillochloris trichoides]EFO79993.1 probable ATP-binding component of ABC transporters [Oscillochloris trichoides DG-6]